ncbi:AraC family transcriptional regulator [Asticcacaulis sp. ZE23SCel15]|uniref:AraC family transcriptional regulator n=1 Tax=Asticcacaulis sp. ZE23SCel15 TaxID=3059027 RepID=UPI00265EE216|nr:AraC family transcriptional regulator [Asticcacaulis sp. ZE23SCel15]WKL56091.1 AraC family transcriptional regulator [Asticcacaulis sp. ZE23SCel15]
MIKMPETSINLPIPAKPDSKVVQLHPRPLSPAATGASPMLAGLLRDVTAYIETQGGGQGVFKTAVSNVNILRCFQAMMPMRKIYKPSMCVTLQGSKEILLGDEQLDYRAMEFLVVSVEVPGSGRIVEASPTEPYVGMVIDFDSAMMRDVMAQVDDIPATPESARCVFVGKVDDRLAECILRLVRLSDTPKAVPVLYPSIMKEIYYWLLTGPHGAQLRKLAMPESNMERVANAIYLIRDNLAKTIRVEALASEARMSPSSFHQHFKRMTSMSPLQYQKQLRLLEARRLLMADAANVSDAAYQVGYESTSQFSREYSRMFGMAPKRSLMTLRPMPA